MRVSIFLGRLLLFIALIGCTSSAFSQIGFFTGNRGSYNAYSLKLKQNSRYAFGMGYGGDNLIGIEWTNRKWGRLGYTMGFGLISTAWGLRYYLSDRYEAPNFHLEARMGTFRPLTSPSEEFVGQEPLLKLLFDFRIGIGLTYNRLIWEFTKGTYKYRRKGMSIKVGLGYLLESLDRTVDRNFEPGLKTDAKLYAILALGFSL